MDILLTNLQSFLLNILLIYFCFTLYFKFLEKKVNRFTHTVIVISICGISIIFSMSFPVILLKDIPIDFRQLPLIIGTLYGGRLAGAILTAILLSYRFYLNVPDFQTAFVVYALMLLLLFFVLSFFKRALTVKKKLWIAFCSSVAAALSTTALNLVLLPLTATVSFLIFTLIVIAVQTSGVLLSVWVIERAKKAILLSEEIAKLEKLKTVSTIAASISHEVRNPLTVTKGFLQLLRDPELSEQDKHYYIDTALEALNRAESIITDYLTFAKPSLVNVEILDLQKELTMMKNFVEPYAALNNVEIKMTVKDNSYVAGEKEKLHQSIINISKNGVEAMPRGGILTIELKRIGNEAIITIADTGVGMDEEQLERLGNPFFTTKDLGTGLGTMVVYSTIKAMRGSIQVKSKPLQGTQFILSLPVVEREISTD
ncbi:ATP-binding protein [Domibacillus robiginosus]|uniref:ATP-binding protein n=1 Tax=Domibacillus robiginosus TaxID=1071054 RepID=UPI00067AF354|nr:ATP-binding protein [Domibacillus robiginosus]